MPFTLTYRRHETKFVLDIRDTPDFPTTCLNASELQVASPAGQNPTLLLWISFLWPAPNLWDLHTPLGVTGSNFTMKPEPRHPPAFGLHLEVRAGHASHNDVMENLEIWNETQDSPLRRCAREAAPLYTLSSA